MNDFTASNGVGIRLTKTGEFDGDLDFKNGPTWLGMCGGPVVQALREFFQAEADERLGRWRWPENPDYVVYAEQPGGDWVRVYSESQVLMVRMDRQKACHDYVDRTVYQNAARAYFDAHPEPKPWHDAKPGELWVIRLAGEEEIGVSVEAFEPGADVFQVPGGESISVTRPSIVAGYRVWPGTSS